MFHSFRTGPKYVQIRSLVNRVPKAVSHYGLAIVSVVMALGITLSLEPYNTLRTPFLYAAILITTWFGGIGPGLLAVALATLALGYYFDPFHRSQAAEIIDLPLVVSFSLLALLITWVSAKRKGIQEALKQKNEELQQTLLKLKETQQELVMQSKMASLGSLVAGVAHEVNNPIGAVNSSADVSIRCIDRLYQLLETSQSLDEVNNNHQFRQLLTFLRENNQIMLTAGDRIAKIVRSLKNFARLDEAELQEANLHDGLESTLTLVHHEIKNRATVIREYGEVPPVFCYPRQLNQVFMNLFVNAAQAIEKDGVIRIKTFSDGTYAYVKITDTGKGIPPENLSKIFDPGFTTKGVGVGTGLGLSISYNIIRKHKGEIRVESQVGRGTEFTLKLPIHETRSWSGGASISTASSGSNQSLA
jgi:signal transduction histidine kinase